MVVMVRRMADKISILWGNTRKVRLKAMKNVRTGITHCVCVIHDITGSGKEPSKRPKSGSQETANDEWDFKPFLGKLSDF